MACPGSRGKYGPGEGAGCPPDQRRQALGLLEWVVLAAVATGGLMAVSPLIIVPAAIALMLDRVLGTALRLRRAQGEPLSSKTTTYLVMGALGWAFAAWAAYVAGAMLRGVL